MLVGVMAVQGAFAEHGEILRRLNVPFRLVRQRKDLKGIDHLILPGGESTAMRRLLCGLDMFSCLAERIARGMPVMGTCAGLILLADEIEGEARCLGGLPVAVRRNAYGRQLGSFAVTGDVGEIHSFPMRFIRAPYVAKVLSPDVRILNKTDGHITAVAYRRLLGLAFHPELTQDSRIHQYFLSLSA